MGSWKDGKFFQWMRAVHRDHLPQGRLEGGSLVLKFGDEAAARRRTEPLDSHMISGRSPPQSQGPFGSPYMRACWQVNAQGVASASQGPSFLTV